MEDRYSEGETTCFCGMVVRASTFHLGDRRHHIGLMGKESVNTQPKVVGFLRVLRFPPTGKVDRMG